MRIKWTRRAASDLVRLHEQLASVAPAAAAHVIQQLSGAPARLLEYPRIGEKLAAYEPREVRRLIVGDHELRYEITAGTIFVLRLWHCRENRSFAPTGRGSARS